MTEIPFGLSLDQDDNGFVLRQKNSDGTIVAIQMLLEDLFGLKAIVDMWSSRHLQSLQEKSGSLRPIVTHAVQAADLATDALRANILLALQSPRGDHMTFALPKKVAEKVAEEILSLLPQLEDDPQSHH